MVGHLVRLKLTLLRNSLRRSVWQVLGLVAAALYGVLVLALVAAGLVALSFQDAALRETVLVLLGSALVLGWCVVPLVAFGVDATLDPRRFVTYGVPRRDLLVGLTLAGLVGVPGVVTALVALGTAAVWWREPLAALAAVVGAVLALATCLVGARATTAALAPVIARRRVRELVAVLAVLLLALTGPILAGLTNGVAALGEGGLRRVVDVLGWTPPGAAWGLGAAVAAGDAGAAALRLLVAVATVALAYLVWDRALTRSLVQPVAASHEVKARGLGWFGRLPATPAGAIAARAATYWLRDPRYATAVAIVPVLPVVLGLSGAGDMLLVCGPLTGVLVGWSVSADVAYDGTAFWTHLAAPVRGVVDRRGRVVVAGTLGAVATVAVTVGTAVHADAVQHLPALLGAGLGLLLTSLGGASVVSALVVYPVQQPGDNPFSTKQGVGAAAFTSQLVGGTAVLALAAPTLVLTVLAVVRGSTALGWVALAVGLVLGTGLLVGGVVWGGRILDRTGPDLLGRMRAFP
ncbi:hypothetical protein [Cellulomonas shaoxiangyii]|uniref:Transporter n=1 Tax=Cellulomonas shaoxiangyii TaxID=2566013 RepID=A0A4P7SKH4_9CELL|nr:hypothetical protein [Cellulomonas shaoxiangyii]QCB94361.1 hypothetical protein E5225_13145 [Cellulomonas shaoxiangyii]TGY85200.1 hypothetical protein E5226_07730 [Cellulomonas shaoxiangyii]